MLTEQEAFDMFLANQPIVVRKCQRFHMMVIQAMIRPLKYEDDKHATRALYNGWFDYHDAHLSDEILLKVRPVDKPSGRLETARLSDVYPLTKEGIQAAREQYISELEDNFEAEKNRLMESVEKVLELIGPRSSDG